MSILQFAQSTLYRGVKVTTLHLLIMFLDHLKSPQKRTLSSNVSRYERTVFTKKRRVANDERASAAQSLLELSESCNGSEYCEPYTGIASSTTMNDIVVLERENHTLHNENSQLHHECEQQRIEIQRLTNENTHLKEKKHEIQERCKELEDAKSKLNTLNFSQASLSNDDSKVKYYTGLPSFAVLLAVFNLVNSGVEVTSRFVLSLFQQMILVLMKLRLNFGDQDLAFRLE